MSRTPSEHDLSSAVGRLRTRLFVLSIAAMALLCTLVAAWRLASGAGPAELLAPLAGAVLALAAELLCLDLALRRAHRTLAPERAVGGEVRRALGV